jgi:hypothetical protein
MSHLGTRQQAEMRGQQSGEENTGHAKSDSGDSNMAQTNTAQNDGAEKQQVMGDGRSGEQCLEK